MAKFIKKATKSPLFLFVAGLVIVAGAALLFIPSSSEAGAGAIWTTNGDCGDETQDVNHYDIGDVVFINGRGFDASTPYDWFIKGKPGSSDPNIKVAEGNDTTDENGSFCFQAYTVQNGDEGVYSVKFGNKNDNYIVSETMGAITIRKEGSHECSMYTEFDMYLKDSNQNLIRSCNNNAYCLNFNEEVTTMLTPGTYRAGEIHYESQYNWSINCDSNFTQYNTNQGHEAEVNLQAGQHITCTFTNTEREGIKVLYAEARDSTTNELVIGAWYEIDLLEPPAPGNTCPGGTHAGIGYHDGHVFNGQVIEPADGKVRLINTTPNCNYRIRMASVPAGYVSPVTPQVVTNPLISEGCPFWVTFYLDPKYATINVHKNVLHSTGADISDNTNFTARVNGEDKTFSENSSASYTVLAKTTDVKEVNAETNPNFVFEGCTIDTGHTTENITNGIKIRNIQEDDVINVTCTNRRRTSCGDGITQDPNERGESEQCDNGAQNTDFACSPRYNSSCTYCTTSCQEITVNGPYCGDDKKNSPEECDGSDGITEHYTCTANCTLEYVPYCGDGNPDPGEECDDGNNADGDGCSAQCENEPSHIYGRKVNDKNNSGTQNASDAWMNNWTIRLYDSNWNQVGVDHLTGETGTAGQFHFEIDTLDTYYVCEELQSGWTQTWPSSIANQSGVADEAPYCRQVNVTEYGTDYTNKTFGNFYAGYCSDGTRQTPNAEGFNEQCDDNNNVDGDGCSATCTLESGSIKICKYEDFETIGQVDATDLSNPLEWDVKIELLNQAGGVEDLWWFTTDPTSGCVETPVAQGTYRISEADENGWRQTLPNNDGTWGTYDVTISSQNMNPEFTFLNYKVPVCGNTDIEYGEACDDGNTNDDDTCKNDCTVNTHTCGNGILQTDLGEVCDDGANNGVACIADYDKTCTYCSAACAIVTVTGPSTVTATPVITLAKIDTPDPIAAGADLTYTLNFTISNAAVTGLVMTDEIPANTTFVSASDPGVYDAATNKVTWNYGNLAAGNYVATLKVKVYSPLANGTKITNTAIIDSNETDPAVTATAETTTSTAPILTMDKLVDNASALAGDTINYTVKITNSGTDAATNVKLTDTLPAGLTFVDNGTTTMTYSFGNIESGKTVATTYAVKIDSAIAAGTYTNSAVVTADNHADLTDSVDVAVSVPIVLGEETEEPAPEVKVLGEELPETGANALVMLLSGLALVGSGFILRKKAQ